MRSVVLSLLFLIAAPYAGAAEPFRILFIGNSLTATNDLPATVCRLARAAGRKVECVSHTRSGFSLDDHLASGEAIRLIESHRWSLVVLQQGPSALEESRLLLRAAVKRFAPLITAAGARPGLYSVWPSRVRSFDFPRVAESYFLAAGDVGGYYFAAGDAWQAAWARDRSMPLYGPDGFHPSQAGSYLAALVIYRQIWRDLPASFADPDVARISLTPASLRVLWEVARGNVPRRPNRKAP